MKKLTTEIFIERSNLVHNQKEILYTYERVVYINNSTDVEIFCVRCQEYFWQRPANHLHGGHWYCNNRESVRSRRITQEQFIQRSNLIHNQEKIKYKYDKVKYIDFFTPVEIWCERCQKYFWQKPKDHLRERGCRDCGKKDAHDKQRSNTKEFIEKATKLNGTKFFDYGLVNYIDSHTEVEIICKICETHFWQTPAHHLNGEGCFYCNGGKKLTKDQFVRKANYIHNNRCDYTLSIYINAITEIEIICKTCNTHFWQTPNNHTNKINPKGCPHCKMSKGELKIKNWLKKNNIFYEYEKRFKECKSKIMLPFDFYLPDFNLCIEYDGKQHFEENEFFKPASSLEETQKRDQIKTDYCLKKGIGLLRIPYWEYKNIEKILDNYFYELKLIRKVEPSIF